MLILFAEDFFLNVMLSIWFHDAKSDEVFLGLLIVPNSMVDNASLKIVLADIRLHFDQLIKTNDTVYIVSYLFIAFRLQINKPWKIFFPNFLHAIFS
jgi:hypothetical protein